jgi:hypothetical protein
MGINFGAILQSVIMNVLNALLGKWLSGNKNAKLAGGAPQKPTTVAAAVGGQAVKEMAEKQGKATGTLQAQDKTSNIKNSASPNTLSSGRTLTTASRTLPNVPENKQYTHKLSAGTANKVDTFTITGDNYDRKRELVTLGKGDKIILKPDNLPGLNSQTTLTSKNVNLPNIGNVLQMTWGNTGNPNTQTFFVKLEEGASIGANTISVSNTTM